MYYKPYSSTSSKLSETHVYVHCTMAVCSCVLDELEYIKYKLESLSRLPIPHFIDSTVSRVTNKEKRDGKGKLRANVRKHF